MAYTKQNFMDGLPLSAAELNRMEDGIAEAHELAGNAQTEAEKAVRYDVQTLTDEQKTQARKNIGAVGEETEVKEQLDIELFYGAVPKISQSSNKVDYTFKHDEGVYGYADVSNAKTVLVTGRSWVNGYDYRAWWFLDENDNVLSYEYGSIPDSTAFTDVEVSVPVGAKKIGINGRVSFQTPSAKGVAVISATDVIAKAYDIQNRKPSVIVMGDSITALGTNDNGWVKYFLESTNCKLIANTAVNGAHLKDKNGTVYDGAPVFNGEDNNVNNVLGNQVQKIIDQNYESPNIIIIAVGTNDGITITEEQINGAYYDSNNELIPLGEVDRKTSAGAYRYCSEKLHELYPNAVLCWSTPIMAYQKTRNPLSVMDWAKSLSIATEHTGQILIDTVRCGINSAYEASGTDGDSLSDGLHPNVNGAKKIGYYIASKVMPLIASGFVES